MELFLLLQDTNECCTKKRTCHPNAECVNLIGSFYCRCRHGYTGDGFSCAGNRPTIKCQQSTILQFTINY